MQHPLVAHRCEIAMVSQVQHLFQGGRHRTRVCAWGQRLALPSLEGTGRQTIILPRPLGPRDQGTLPRSSNGSWRAARALLRAPALPSMVQFAPHRNGDGDAILTPPREESV